MSSGALGAGQIRSHAKELNDELVTTHQIIERCAMLVDDELAKTASYYLMKLGSWIETACQDGTKLSQIFSVRAAISGDGRSKETALFFKKATTHHEAMEAFYQYLRARGWICWVGATQGSKMVICTTKSPRPPGRYG